MVALNLATLLPCWLRLWQKKVSMYSHSVSLCLLWNLSHLYCRHCIAALLSAGDSFVDVCVAQVFFDDLFDEFVSFHEYCTHIFVCFDNYVFWIFSEIG
jgi:hypothetical protein